MKLWIWLKKFFIDLVCPQNIQATRPGCRNILNFFWKAPTVCIPIFNPLYFRGVDNGTIGATKSIQTIPIELLKNSTDVTDKAQLELNGLSNPLVNPYVGQICK